MIAEIEPTSYIVIGVFVLTIFGVAYGLFTRRGSGINEHPGPDSVDPVIAEPEPPDGDEDAVGSAPIEDHILEQRGTK